MKKKNPIIFICLSWFALLLASGNLGAQVKKDCYNNRYKDRSIKHKYARWFDLRNGLRPGDTFSEDQKWFEMDGPLAGTKIQATHTYIDTIYVHKGTSVKLSLPDKHGVVHIISVKSYQRWYDFRTDRTFKLENESAIVKDLLTPADSTTPYRLENGYVGNPLGDSSRDMMFYFPTDKEFAEWFPNTSRNPDIDNDWFAVACDVSSYQDYTASFDADHLGKFKDTFYEPTLSHRIIYYIRAVEKRNPDKKSNWYKESLESGQYQGASGQYLETYDISLPCVNVSITSDEVVATSKDARSYAIPGVVNDHSDLSVSMESNEARIVLATPRLSGEERVIRFRYPKTEKNTNCGYVEPNTKATILVKKEVNGTTYNIAKFNLTFTKDTRLLTQTQVKEIEEGNESIKGTPWATYQFRTPKFLEENYEKVAYLDFDYDKDPLPDYGQPSRAFYPFPVAWEYSSYAFFDGAKDLISYRNHINPKLYTTPEWGYYALMDNYIETMPTEQGGWNQKALKKPSIPLSSSTKEKSTYHLYVDASDRPGTIVRIPFQGNAKLCPGTELFVSAWVKTAGWKPERDLAGMMFTIVGKKGDTYTPIYRYYSSMIRNTGYIEKSSIPGTGGGNNEWFQLYFSFMSEEDKYDYYLLQIDNSGAGADNGDMYLDDVRVYMGKPKVEAKQAAPVCSARDTRIRLQIDYDRILRAVGKTETKKADADITHLYFTIIDKEKYNAYKNEHNRAPQNLEDYQMSLRFLKKVTGQPLGLGEDTKVGRLDFSTYFDTHSVYDEKEVGSQVPGPTLDGSGSGSWLRLTKSDGGQTSRFLAVDISASLETGKPYYLVASQRQEAFNLEDRCALIDEFEVQPSFIIKVKGSAQSDTTAFCEGDELDVAIDVTVPKKISVADTILRQNVYFDWFFGTLDEYNASIQKYGGVSLAEALIHFREVHQDAVSVDDHTVLKDQFTANMRDLLIAYISDANHPRLLLHRKNLDHLIMRADVKNLVVKPIEITVDKGDGSGSASLICWEPFLVPLKLKSPTLHVGFNDVTYPKEFEPAVRLGLQQIVRSTRQDDRAISINLRGAGYVRADAKELNRVRDENRQRLFLIGSDDPVLKDLFKRIGSSPYDYPVARIESLHAVSGDGFREDDLLKVRFDLTGDLTKGEGGGTAPSFVFNPREGYRYTLMAPFAEVNQKVSPNGSCSGELRFDMKIVPAYQKWKGTGSANWNDDANWVRSTREELKKSEQGDYRNYKEEHKGFVPMYFTNVTLRKDTVAQLYVPAGDAQHGTNIHPILALETNRPAVSGFGAATVNIEYDLMVTDDLDCRTYYTNTVGQIHFEPNTQLLHAEYLSYEKAWVEYGLKKGQWYTLASPLQAVVSGDWYTDKKGTEEQEYFTDIAFDAAANSRFAPSVYQRGWKGETSSVILYERENKNTDGSIVPITRTVAVKGNWSSVYNDVAVPYNPGSGFSLRAQDGKGDFLFRLPKSDEKYAYHTKDGKVSEIKTHTVRNGNAGRLKSDDLKRTPASFTISLEDRAAGSDFYLVGNPFMAGLDAKAFFDANHEVLEPKYWTVARGGQTVAVGSDNGWISTETGTPVIAPLQSFFVRKKTGAVSSDLLFTAAMQTIASDQSLMSGGNAAALRLTATAANGNRSRAVVAYDGTASADFEEKEDAGLFVDSNLGDAPMVYTVAGTKAASVNRTSELGNIPVGVYGSASGTVTLSVSGLKPFGHVTLYDAEKRKETVLHDGGTLSLSVNDHGRYFLRAGTPTANETVMDDELFIYALAKGHVIVSSASAPLRQILVYNIGGALVRQISVNANRHDFYLPAGLYVIQAETSGKVISRKISIR